MFHTKNSALLRQINKSWQLAVGSWQLAVGSWQKPNHMIAYCKLYSVVFAAYCKLTTANFLFC